MELAALLLDVMIVLLLGATIFYARRLYSSVAVLRTGREELTRLMNDLSDHIARAEQAIKNMNKTTDEGANDLHDMIVRARNLTEELKFMHETGDSLAGRLEKLAEQARPPGSGGLPDLGEIKAEGGESLSSPVFDIIDREAEIGDDDHSDADLGSQAEKELQAALKKKKKAARK